ncbi:response regulator transcription factor [Streptomyces sp. CBMA156]|uniref:response regulator transcription factor n=1 Tax=Streptomyces sp. CBMA156 TaxID=1930280 RepID=UPI002950073E|nr:response regulator transcription factor [Streptomyces sp. CBMA156]
MSGDVSGDVRVVICDDQALVRAGFRVLVDTTPGLTVVGEAGDGAEAVEVIRRERPDVALMDIQMPGMDGIEATRRLLGGEDPPPVRILILTTFDLDRYVFTALHAGASGFLLKDTPPEDLLSAIGVIADGEALLSPRVTRKLVAEFTRRPQVAVGANRRLDEITDREREVLVLIANGMSNTEIADGLHLSHSTIKFHVSRLLAKLGARDRAQLVIAAYESGLMNHQ